MPSAHSIVGALVIGCASLLLQACGKSDSGSKADSGSGSGAPAGSGLSGAYSSVADDGLTMELKSGGSVVMSAQGLGSSSGTYVTDGEKIVISIDQQQHTFIRDGNCIADQRNEFGKLCIGGKAGEASNVSTRNVPAAPTGTYIASNADGEFKIEFKPGNTLTLFMTPTAGKPETHDGKFVIEGDTFYATLDPGISMVLKYVNNTYESSAFGLPMKFVKR